MRKHAESRYNSPPRKADYVCLLRGRYYPTIPGKVLIISAIRLSRQFTSPLFIDSMRSADSVRRVRTVPHWVGVKTAPARTQ